MGCCGKKDGCKHEQNLPTEAFFNVSPEIIAPLATKLLDIAAAGLRANTILRQFTFSNPDLDVLAKKIADLAIENEYLRKITDLFSPTCFNTEGGNLEIMFGPKNDYALKIPLTTKHDREKIVTQLRTAADKVAGLDASKISAQKVLPFLAHDALSKE